MIQRSIKTRNGKGFTLTEVIISSVILVLLFFAVMLATVMLKEYCYTSIAQHVLQRDAAIMMNYIVKHGPGEISYNGLRSAASYNINAIGDISFIDKTGITRRYYQQGNSIVYQSPTAPSGSGGSTIYTAPANATLTLIFIQPNWSVDPETVWIYIAISQIVAGKPVSGNLSTFVNIRNLQKS